MNEIFDTLPLIFVILYIYIYFSIFNIWHINEYLSHDECYLDQKELLLLSQAKVLQSEIPIATIATKRSWKVKSIRKKKV